MLYSQRRQQLPVPPGPETPCSTKELQLSLAIRLFVGTYLCCVKFCIDHFENISAIHRA